MPVLSEKPDNVCILRLSALGDICHTLPVVRTLQAAWPDTRFTWIIGALEHQLVGDTPGIDFVIYNKKTGRQGMRALAKTLPKFDLLLHMQASLRSSQLARKLNVPVRLGFDKKRAKDFQWLFTNARIAPGERQHVIDGLFGFAQACGIHDRVLRWDIPIPPEAATYAAQLTQAHPRYLILSPCSSQRSRNFRNWSAENYAATADHAWANYRLKTIITGGPTELEQQYGHDIMRLATCEPINLVGQTSIKQLFALIHSAKLVLSPDSGPAHMATAAGVPSLGLYAGSNPQRTGPYLSERWVVNKYPEAVEKEFGKPVDQISWGKRVRDPAVMDSIALQDVIDRLAAMHQARMI